MTSVSRSLVPTLLVLMMIIQAIPANAQLSEGEMTGYVPAETFLFVSINMESVLEQIDSDHEILKEFRERDRKRTSDFTEAAQYLFVISSNEDAVESEIDFPGVAIVRYNDVIDQDVFQKDMSAQTFGNMTFEAEDFYDHELFVGSYDEGEGTFVIEGSSQAYFFPADNISAAGTAPLLKLMIENHEDDSPGKELVGNTEHDADLHFVLEDGANLTAIPMFSFMEGGVPGFDLREILESIERAELIADMDQMTPVRATIELKTPEDAEKLEELIQTGLQAVPGLMMMAEGELDSAVENDAEEIAPIEKEARQLVELGRKAAAEVEMSRNDATLEIQLGNIEGLDQFAQSLIVFIAFQQMSMERFMDEIPRMGAEIEVGDIEIMDEAKAEDDKSDDDDDDGDE